MATSSAIAAGRAIAHDVSMTSARRTDRPMAAIIVARAARAVPHRASTLHRGGTIHHRPLIPNFDHLPQPTKTSPPSPLAAPPASALVSPAAGRLRPRRS